jgi:hypothetical protein
MRMLFSSTAVCSLSLDPVDAPSRLPEEKKISRTVQSGVDVDVHGRGTHALTSHVSLLSLSRYLKNLNPAKDGTLLPRISTFVELFEPTPPPLSLSLRVVGVEWDRL